MMFHTSLGSKTKKWSGSTKKTMIEVLALQWLMLNVWRQEFICSCLWYGSFGWLQKGASKKVTNTKIGFS